MKTPVCILSLVFSVSSAHVAAKAEQFGVYEAVLVRPGPEAAITIDGHLGDWEGIDVKARQLLLPYRSVAL